MVSARFDSLGVLPELVRLFVLWFCALLSLLQKDTKAGPVLGVPESLRARPEHHCGQSLWSKTTPYLCSSRSWWCLPQDRVSGQSQMCRGQKNTTGRLLQTHSTDQQ